MPSFSKKITFWAKLATFFGLLLFIAYTVRQQPTDWKTLADQLRTINWSSPNALILLALTPLNWSVEALKWQWLARRVQPLRFTEALGGVLAGLSLGMALPGLLGDTAGRVFSIQARPGQDNVPERAAAVGAALVSGGMQFYVAVVVGTVAWATYLRHVPVRATPGSQALLVLLGTLSGLGVVLNFYRHRFVSWSVRWPWLGTYAGYWAVIGHYSHADMAGAFGLAMLRHLIFSVQLFAAFRLYGVELAGIPLSAGVGVIYLVKTIAPAFNWLSDLGIREAAALWVFAPFGLPAPLLLTATLTLWLINILFPVLIGLAFVGRTVGKVIGEKR